MVVESDIIKLGFDNAESKEHLKGDLTSMHISAFGFVDGYNAALNNVKNNKIMNKYIISPITTYNEDEELWETKVGYDDKEKTLIFIVCGKTWLESKSRAENIMLFITNTVYQVI